MLYPLFLGDFTYERDYHIAINAYDSYLFFYVREGKGYLEFDGRKYHLSKGQACLIDCYQPHAYGSDSGWEIEWIHFDGRCAGSYSVSYTHLPGWPDTASRCSTGWFSFAARWSYSSPPAGGLPCHTVFYRRADFQGNILPSVQSSAFEWPSPEHESLRFCSCLLYTSSCV